MDNLYYSNRRRKKKRGFFTPFLIILCVLVILVLIVQIVSSLRMQTDETKRNQAFVYIERGKVEFQPWGQDVWHEAYNQALIWEGDHLRTGKDSYAVLEFYDGSRLRINEETELLVQKIEVEKKAIGVEIRLISGEVWLNEQKTDENLKFRVFTPHLDITSLGTRYSVSIVDPEFVRVTEGEVKAMVYDSFTDDPELLDSVSIGIGQQVSVSASDIEALQARKFVNLLESTDDYWRVTEWYLWNIREDETPTLYTKESVPKKAEDQRDSVLNPEPATESLDTVDGNSGAPAINVPAPKVTITNPATSPYELKDTRIYLKGTVSSDVTKVIVTEFYDDPKGTPYQLSKFVPGSGVWNYAAGLDFGNLKSGKNRFVVQAYNSDGLVSDPVEMFIVAMGDEEEDASVIENTVDKPEVIDEAITPPEEVVSMSVTEEPVASANSITKTQPKISSYEEAEKTRENYFLTTSDRVVINGSTGGASDVSKVIVNGWPLSLYESGSTQWVYYAKSSIGTLKTGINVYNVYTENAKGERSLSLTFTIEKK
ncbi:MAG: FecR family protein [Candidatus Peregrinibacteria bacterium]|nr:FecR family protein [Candidatus Peregrinibacteria bacterium]MDZ4245051.1 FecR family protein [Candidatus Gracilibacteria bacterium]